MKELDYDEIIRRIGYFRNKANISSRELSQRLGYNPQFLKTIETKQVQLKVKTLLNICIILNISIFDFIYLGEKYNQEYKNYLQMFQNLPDNKKNIIIDLLKVLKE